MLPQLKLGISLGVSRQEYSLSYKWGGNVVGGIDRGNVRLDVGSQCLLPPSGNLLLKGSAIFYRKSNWCSDGNIGWISTGLLERAMSRI